MSNDALETIFAPGGFLAGLRESCARDWQDYVAHPFVKGLGDGSLPEASFRHYLVQDYLFLIHFARAYALAAYKGETLEEIGSAMRACAAIVDTEMALHLTFCAEWGLSEADMAATPEATGTLAYTRYVLERGVAGDLLDLHVALAPCVLGYAEIGLALSQGQAALNAPNPYRPWIEMYAGEEYQAVAREASHFIEALSHRRGADARRHGLEKVFADATRLEIAFWDQGMAV
ncbi:MAG: thiaminase II [Rhodospirillaceae bacterium]|jgi:thiaminase (transcriptional activator TenA)|nr:thiaminase II [Rhodospirillaceae bacterium]MBT5456178.1 thiaminase II [Rhodospirillaceae bacterium]